MSDTFPRQHARTQRLTLGEPRSFVVSPDGERVVFARSASGSDTVNMLWVLDVPSSTERLVLDPRSLGTDLSTLTDEEKRRRERAREGAGGVVSYSCDADVTRAVAVLGGQPVVVDLLAGAVTVPGIAPGVFDARLSPDGSQIAYVRGGSLCVCGTDGTDGTEKLLASDPSSLVTWGSADFIAAEEMGRQRGFWWSPDGTSILAARVDNSPVGVWWIADPANPASDPVSHRYPATGTPNADVTLALIDVGTGSHVPVELPGEFEYVNSASWTGGGLVVQVQTRDQRQVDIHRIDPATGGTEHLWTDTDDAWVELVPGVPVLDTHGHLFTCADRDGARRVLVDGTPVTPPGLQVRSVLGTGTRVTFVANETDVPWVHNIWAVNPDGTGLENLTPVDGVVSAVVGGSVTVTRTATLGATRAMFAVHSDNRETSIRSHAEEPLVHPNVRILKVGPRAVPVAILTPRDGLDTKLPVLFDPYGGPHAQRVLSSNAAFATSQWFAEQGFVVVVADNRGTPGLGSAWEREVLRDLAGPVLEDQVEVARALDGIEPRADVSRIAIRGWSFGGYLAALAVLRAPDVFRAGIAGAPVTDWRLYDTHYTERYLGNPSMDDRPYVATSLIEDARLLSRPLLIIHGLADDNVVAAHTLQLSSALLAAGRPHEVLPLSGVTHMTPQEVVAENLLLHQLEFLRRTVG
ncbi:MAG: prolyl oligopeptidase family serine peptidase [Actinomycetota bacterium]